MSITSPSRLRLKLVQFPKVLLSALSLLVAAPSHATIINAFGKDISIPESCVFKANTAIQTDPTFFCNEAFITLLSKDKAEIEELKKSEDAICSKTYLVNGLEVTRITMAFVKNTSNSLYFNFICERNECILVSSKKNEIFDAILKQVRIESK